MAPGRAQYERPGALYDAGQLRAAPRSLSEYYLQRLHWFNQTSIEIGYTDGMSKTFRPFDIDQPLLLPPDLREWLPENHLVFHQGRIDRCSVATGLRRALFAKWATAGFRASVNPTLMDY